MTMTTDANDEDMVVDAAGRSAADPAAPNDAPAVDTAPEGSTGGETVKDGAAGGDTAPAVPADAAGIDAEDDLDELVEVEPPRPPSPFDRPGEWFVVHTYAGYENKVK